jgi:hypothetical protein
LLNRSSPKKETAPSKNERAVLFSSVEATIFAEVLDASSSTEILLFVIIIASHIELSYLKFDVPIIAQSENAFKIFFTDTEKKLPIPKSQEKARGGKGKHPATSRPSNTGRQSHPHLQLSNCHTIKLSNCHTVILSARKGL